jgi:lambda family phage tail tape measure protein
MLAQKEQEDLQLQTEFAEKHREIVLGETEFKLQQIEAQADAYRKAGNDSVAVAQWEKEMKLRLSRDWADGAVRALREYNDEATNAARNVENAITSAAGSIEDALVNAFTTGKFEARDMVNSIIADMARITVRQSITGPLTGMLGGLFSFNALGGVYSGPGISAYSGKVVDSPTVFPFAKGVGLMGEAGAEAIMPLTRTSGGELGVQAVGGAAAAPQIEIVINNDSGVRSRVASQQTSFDSGRMITRIVVENLASNTDGMGDAMRGVMGVR